MPVMASIFRIGVSISGWANRCAHAVAPRVIDLDGCAPVWRVGVEPSPLSALCTTTTRTNLA